MADLAQLYASLFGAGLSGDNPDLLAGAGQAHGLDTTLADAQDFLAKRQMIPSPSAAGAGGPSIASDPSGIGGATGAIGGEFPKAGSSGGSSPAQQMGAGQTGLAPGPNAVNTPSKGTDWGGAALGAAPGLAMAGLNAAGSAGMLGGEIAGLAGGLGLGLAPLTSFIPFGDILPAMFGMDTHDPQMDRMAWMSAANGSAGEMMGSDDPFGFGMSGDRGAGMPLNAATTPDELYGVLMGGEYGRANAGSQFSGFPGSENRYRANQLRDPALDARMAAPSDAFRSWMQDPAAMNLSMNPIFTSLSGYRPPDLSGFNSSMTDQVRQQAQLINLLQSLNGVAPPDQFAGPINDLYGRHTNALSDSAARRARQEANAQVNWNNMYGQPTGGPA